MPNFIIAVAKTVLAFFLCSYLLFSNEDTKDQEVTEVNANLLENLLENGTYAPKISGSLFMKPQYKITDASQFNELLSRHSVDYKGKITVLQFWEKDCQYCLLLLPKLERVFAKYREKNISFYAVNPNDLSDKKKLTDFLNSYENTKIEFDEVKNKATISIDSSYYKPFKVPILFVEKSIQKNFQIGAFPALYVIDENGMVYTGMIGYFEEYDKWLSNLLDIMLNLK